jgi:hypothetical protein
MKNEIEKTEFKNWCRLMYDENCQERWRHGQNPYKNFNTYYTKHLEWLETQYKQRRTTKNSLYLL